MSLRAHVVDVPGFPRDGIVFRDITPLIADAAALDRAVTQLADAVRGWAPDLIVGAEARGFLLGPALARELGAGFVPARKPGKLPRATHRAEYELEYGVDALELHRDAVPAGARVLVHDDLLATGGTAAALCELVAATGGVVVGCAFVVELAFLGGAARLAPHQVVSLIRDEAE